MLLCQYMQTAHYESLLTTNLLLYTCCLQMISRCLFVVFMEQVSKSTGGSLGNIIDNDQVVTGVQNSISSLNGASRFGFK